MVNLLCRQFRRAVAAKDGAADALGENEVVADLNRGRGRREGHHGRRGVPQGMITAENKIYSKDQIGIA